MTITRAIYLILHILTMFIMYKSGQYMSKSKNTKEYWSRSLPAILAYGVCVGLRFGRGTDYNAYAQSYLATINDINYSEEGFEIAYRFITWFVGQIGVPFWLFVFFCSIFFVVSFIWVLKDYKECAHWALLLFPIISMQAENLIRWYLALSFLLCAYKMLTERKILGAIVLTVISVLTHTGMLVLLLLIIPVFYIPQKLPVAWALLLMIASVYLGSQDNYLSFLTPYVVLFSVNDKSSNYVEGFERTFIDDNTNYYGSDSSILLIIVRLLVYTYVIVASHKLYKLDIITARQCNYTYLAIMLAPLFSSFNVLARFPDSLMLFYCITFSLCIVCTKKYMRKDLIFKYLRIIAIIFTFYGTIMIWMTKLPDSNYLYIWDSNGATYLNSDVGIVNN